MKPPTRSEAQKRALRELEQAKRRRRDAENSVNWAREQLRTAEVKEQICIERATALGAIKK